MRILVTGVNGQVGGELMDLGIAGCELIPADRDVLDLADPSSIEVAYARIAPDLVVNCAAYTSVDKAEDQVDLAFAINSDGPKYLAKLCAENEVPLIQISTDYVFDGSKAGAYTPSDPVQPLGVYGASKEVGEQAVRKLCPAHVILRTAWVFSARGNNFVKTMLRVGETTEELGVVADQIGLPTSGHDIAQAIAAIVGKIRTGNEPWGIYHFCNAGAASWHEFAQEIFATAETSWGRKPEVEAITTAQYPTKAARPANSVLSTETFETTFEFKSRPWRLALADVLDELLTTREDAR
jgi:dTDP-4-dehydrorhamnose reductase